MDERLIELLRQAETLKQELDSLRPLDAEREAIVTQKLRLDWNFHSNHIEGNSLTFGETKALILFGITAQGKPLKDHVEITGHNEAIQWVEDVIKKKEPLTENFIRQLHELLLKKPHEVGAITPDGQSTKKLIKVGQYKTTPNHVRTKTGEIFRFATPEETPAMMTDLMEWLKEKESAQELHPLLLAANFHYKFIRIHPFDDGNGRMARILMNFILMQYHYPPVIVKSQEKAQYIAALEQADAGIYEPFFEFIAENLIRSLEIMLKGARGESVEEPDDLDKELALLEQRLKRRRSESENKGFEKNVTNVIKYSLINLYKQIVLEFGNLNPYYENILVTVFGGHLVKSNNEVGSEYYGKVDRKNGFFLYSYSFTPNPRLDVGLDENQIQKYAQFFIPEKLSVLELEYILAGFKIPHVNGTDYQGRLLFNFNESTYSIEFNEYNIEKKYNDFLKIDEVKEIVLKLKKGVVDYLKSLEN